MQKLKGKAMISTLMKVAWTAYIYYVWRERNARVFGHKEETGEQVLCHIKEAVRVRLN